MSTEERLKSFIERVEKLEVEKKGVSDDISDVYAEAKSNGFDVKAMKKVVALRRMTKDERDNLEAIVRTYLDALEA